MNGYTLKSLCPIGSHIRMLLCPKQSLTLQEPRYQIPEQATEAPQLPPRPPRVVSTGNDLKETPAEPEKEEGLDGISSILQTLAKKGERDITEPSEPSMALPEHRGRYVIRENIEPNPKIENHPVEDHV